ncbi:Zn(2)-C6 fungal-type domain-containing protein [Mycena venus]|uniref:Zn(2)-C6 fungal-type domain-containing protein n=1 Tax=Mycena venus TaxID=2733690 RepID=A0A8H6X7T3_9AGAR|nr:Zn(2)-C6 fungal-type domain-containing protein [Mycena venus]
MAVRHQSAYYSPPAEVSISSDRNAQFHSSPIYGASFGGNTYRYHPHATPVEVQPEPIHHYDYGQVSNVATVNLSRALEGSAIRQPILPTLQIPTPPSEHRLIVVSPLLTARRRLWTSLPFAFSHWRALDRVKVPPATVSAANMQVPSNAVGGSGSASGSKTAEVVTERRSASPVRPARRTTTTAVIACRQCRARKIRCDSTRPHCSNCSRRDDQCEYDPAPKRRGPDKKPGTRQRRCKNRVESREAEDELVHKPLARLEPVPSGMIALPSPLPVPSPESESAPAAGKKSEKSPKRQKLSTGETSQSLDDFADRMRQQQHPTPTPNVASHSYGRPIRPLIHVPPHTSTTPLRISTDESVLFRHTQLPSSSTQPPSSELSGTRYVTSSSSSYAYDVSPFARSTTYDMGHQPSAPQVDHPKFPSLPSTTVQAAQQGWWDAFLRSYSLREIATDLNFLYTESQITLSFVNVGHLIETLWSPTKYLTLQPAFILASMALAGLLRSSETERGATGRERAALLRHSAQDALERTWREAVWLDASLAEAALIIVQYEASAHPEYHPDRLARAFAFLDEVISVLGLTSIDAGSADVCRYAQGAAPVVNVQPDVQCACFPPGTPPSDPDRVWSSALPWDPSWSEHEIRDEECRRVCWAALSLATSFRTECLALSRPDGCSALSICDPANYLVLFPNELYDRGSFGSGRQEGSGTTAHPKNGIWALYCRSMLLANFCGNVVALNTENREERENQAEGLQESWNEAQAIQDALDGHVCNLHTAVAYLCRENISNAQMIITKGLRNLQGLPSGNRPGPLFNRRQAEEWIYYQAEVVKRVTMSIQYVSDPRGQQLTQRPFSVTWFYHQLAICLLLWENDTSLGDVLELAKSLLIPLDVLNALWPCESIQLQCTALRKQLTAHCQSAGHEPPPPPDYSLPVPRRNS